MKVLTFEVVKVTKEAINHRLKTENGHSKQNWQ